MSYKTLTRDIGCKYCGSSGKQYTHENLGDGDYGDINGTTSCSSCKGKKKFSVMLIATDEECGGAGNWADRDGDLIFGLQCQNGTMRNTEPYYKYGKSMFGQETRRQIGANQYSESCPFCFSTGKKHYVAKKESCSKCRGWGELTESRWEKGFFGNEVKREYRQTCPTCAGKKFSWVIDYALRNSQIHGSNL